MPGHTTRRHSLPLLLATAAAAVRHSSTFMIKRINPLINSGFPSYAALGYLVTCAAYFAQKLNAIIN